MRRGVGDRLWEGLVYPERAGIPEAVGREG